MPSDVVWTGVVPRRAVAMMDRSPSDGDWRVPSPEGLRRRIGAECACMDFGPIYVISRSAIGVGNETLGLKLS